MAGSDEEFIANPYRWKITEEEFNAILEETTTVEELLRRVAEVENRNGRPTLKTEPKNA